MFVNRVNIKILKNLKGFNTNYVKRIDYIV